MLPAGHTEEVGRVGEVRPLEELGSGEAKRVEPREDLVEIQEASLFHSLTLRQLEDTLASKWTEEEEGAIAPCC